MKKITKPVFTPDELDEKKTNLSIGYRPGFLIAGYDFQAPNQSKFKKAAMIVKEQINGTVKRRQAQERINKFGFATFDKNAKIMRFGIKYTSSSNGPSKIGKEALKKYHQLLGYYLQRAGWVNVYEEQQFDNSVLFAVKLDNTANVQNLYTLSPSVGFHYKSERPDMSDIEYCMRQNKLNMVQTNTGRESR